MECASIRNCKYRCVPCSLEDFLSIMHFVLRSFGKYSIFFFVMNGIRVFVQVRLSIFEPVVFRKYCRRLSRARIDMPTK